MKVFYIDGNHLQLQIANGLGYFYGCFDFESYLVNSFKYPQVDQPPAMLELQLAWRDVNEFRPKKPKQQAQGYYGDLRERTAEEFIATPPTADGFIKNTLYKIARDTLRFVEGLNRSRSLLQKITQWITYLHLALSKIRNFGNSKLEITFRVITHYPRRVVEEDDIRAVHRCQPCIARARQFRGHPLNRITALWHDAFGSIATQHA